MMTMILFSHRLLRGKFTMCRVAHNETFMTRPWGDHAGGGFPPVSLWPPLTGGSAP